MITYPERFANGASSTIAAQVAPGDTTIQVGVLPPGILWPSNEGGAVWRAIVDTGVSLEYMLVTAGGGTNGPATLTVTRAIEGTFAVPHSAGVAVAAVVTAGALAQLQADLLTDARHVVYVNNNATPVHQGTGAPAMTFSGVPAHATVTAVITFGGTLGVATFSWYLNGVLGGSGVVTAATVTLGTTGVTASFAAGTYVLNDAYVSTQASPYTPAAGETVVCGLNHGAVVVSLPALLPGQGVTVAVDDAAPPGTNSLTIQRADGGKLAQPAPLNGTATTSIVLSAASAAGETMQFYNGGSSDGRYLFD